MTARLWKYPLIGDFAIVEDPDGGVVLLSDEYGFRVCGLTQEFNEMLPQIPTFASTVLLPFEGFIVYDGLFKTYGVSIGSNMRKSFRESVKQLKSEGKILSTAQELIAAVPKITENAIRRQLKEAQDELDLALNSDEVITGMHRGVLAGLSEEERENAVNEQLYQVMQETLRSYTDNTDGAQDDAQEAVLDKFILVRSEAFRAPVLTKLSEILNLCDTDVLLEIADQWHIAGCNGLQKPKLVKKLACELADSVDTPGLLEERVKALKADKVADLCRLCEIGGRMDVRETDCSVASDLPALFNIEPLVAVFYTPAGGIAHAVEATRAPGGTYSFVIPDEFRGACERLSWDEIKKDAQYIDSIRHYLETRVEFCGMTPLDDACRDYLKLHPELARDGVEVEDIAHTARDVFVEQESDYGILVAPESSFLVHYELCQPYRRNRDISFDEDTMGNSGIAVSDPHLYYGELSEDLTYLRKSHAEVSVRPMTEDILSYGNPFDWFINHPAAIALRNYLDANIPDDKNDYFFADKVVEEFISMSHYGAPLPDYLSYLSDEEEFVFDERRLKRMVDLVTNFVNAMPRWDENGWAPNELLERQTGQRIFYNEDGSIKKVGRNDPCPCGSGKKYKNCCGRPQR